MKKKRKILVVDDEVSNRELLASFLEEADYEIWQAENGQECLEIMGQTLPDLVIMDLIMPLMDGFEAISRIRKNPHWQTIPILVISSVTERKERLKAIDLGANDFINKPYDYDELLLRIRNSLKLKEYSDFLKDYNVILEKEVSQRTLELRNALKALQDSYNAVESAYHEIIYRLSRAAEYRDPETGKHIQRVKAYLLVLGEVLGLENKEKEEIAIASPMHDVGKVGIPDSILLKEGPLSSEEWEIMKTHTTMGYAILKDSKAPVLQKAAEIALTHHERWDGSGYPKGLKKTEIPLSGRMMTLADIYDALRSKRPYKPAFSHEKTCEIILKGDGRTLPSHFDPEILLAFEKRHKDFQEIFETFRDVF
ncbi:MAG: response regulator [Planctomycetota bacterium]|nr:MAG: response regulator [Planctomycetota bacterium]